MKAIEILRPGGPDMLRGIFPVIATISAAGFVRIPDDELAARYTAILEQIAAEREARS